MEPSLTPNRLYASQAFAAALVCIASTGCLALGVPSQRFHDAADQGGILGDFRHSKTPAPAGMTATMVAEGGVVVPPYEYESCSDGQPCLGGPGESTVMGSGVDPMDVHPVTGSCLEPVEEPPEVPWPRYHPVPTRPVFGTPSY
jgi:hypothetical protein